MNSEEKISFFSVVTISTGLEGEKKGYLNSNSEIKLFYTYMQETFAKPVICAGTWGLENCQVFQVWPAVQMLIMQVKAVWGEFTFPIFQGSK